MSTEIRDARVKNMQAIRPHVEKALLSIRHSNGARPADDDYPLPYWFTESEARSLSYAVASALAAQGATLPDGPSP